MLLVIGGLQLKFTSRRVIFGFISKEESLEKLHKAKAGTFIIRFSESHPGAFAIACTSSDPNDKDKVKHYLVKPEELGNGVFACICLCSWRVLTLYGVFVHVQ